MNAVTKRLGSSAGQPVIFEHWALLDSIIGEGAVRHTEGA